MDAKQRYFILLCCGFGIPVLALIFLLLLHLFGVVFFLIATPAYVFYTWRQDQKREVKRAQKILLRAAGIGVGVGIILTLASRFLPYGLVFPLFPSSILWIAFGGHGLDAAMMLGHVIIIAANGLLYSLFGAIYYYFQVIAEEATKGQNHAQS